jgi:hypothetical protein
VATHLSDGRALDHVRQAQLLAKLLLTDVREAVSQLRDDDVIDLTEALYALIDGVPSLNIHLDLPEQFKLDDPARAQVLLRCAQEIITNAVRHANASELWLSDPGQRTQRCRDPRARQWSRRGRSGGRQRPARHARASCAVRRQTGRRHRTRPGLRARCVASP